MLTMTFVTAKALTKEATHAGPARRTKSARASTSYDTSMPFEFLDITIASDEKWSAGETNGNEVAGKGLAAEEISNTSAEFDYGSGEHPQASLGKDIKGEDNGRELSGNDDSKAAKDVDLDEVDKF